MLIYLQEAFTKFKLTLLIYWRRPNAGTATSVDIWTQTSKARRHSSGHSALCEYTFVVCVIL